MYTFNITKQESKFAITFRIRSISKPGSRSGYLNNGEVIYKSWLTDYTKAEITEYMKSRLMETILKGL